MAFLVAKSIHFYLWLQVDRLQILLMQSQHGYIQKTRTLPLAKFFLNTGQKIPNYSRSSTLVKNILISVG